MNRLNAKLTFVVVLCLLFSVGTVFAGGTREQARPTENRVVVNSFLSDAVPRDLMNRKVELFKQQHPEYEVELNVFPHEDFKTLIRTWLAADTGPDVVTWFSGERLRFFLYQDRVARIDQVFEPEGFDAFFPAAYRDAVGYQGNLYMVPMYQSWAGVWYRKSVFEQHGLSIPTTWDELIAVSERFQSAGITPLVIGTRQSWPAASWFTYIALRVHGYDFYMDLMEGKIPYTDPRVRSVFADYWQRLVDRGFFLEDHASYTWQEAATYLFSGEGAMYLMGSWVFDAAPQEIRDDLAFFSFPKIRPGVEVVEEAPLTGIMVPANARNVEGGRRFMRLSASQEVQQWWADIGRVPVNVNTTPAPHAVAGVRMLAEADRLTQWYDRDTDEGLAVRNMEYMVEFMLNPGSLDRVLRDMESERARVFR